MGLLTVMSKWREHQQFPGAYLPHSQTFSARLGLAAHLILARHIMAELDLNHINWVILLYLTLAKRARCLRLLSLHGSSRIEFLRQWLQKAEILNKDRQLCQNEIGTLIGSSIDRIKYPWNMFDTLVEVMKWHLEGAEMDAVDEEEDIDDAGSVHSSEVFKRDPTIDTIDAKPFGKGEDNDGEDDDEIEELGMVSRSQSGEEHDPIHIDD
ncbi:hypothetical protein JAAARDRAFT_51583 [Jaapia argillacea MUCL 33604]|uniref:Uncharacterized protein n=1 Tax=Jaapia argillacea MUCL 33604 TaxID=933084 RepID=A0A067P4S7_9AGAM|nr:hypothetical protein JAAARDRAFT_51583 [Jaapia argillacea MUCL 33604]